MSAALPIALSLAVFSGLCTWLALFDAATRRIPTPAVRALYVAGAAFALAVGFCMGGGQGALGCVGGALARSAFGAALCAFAFAVPSAVASAMRGRRRAFAGEGGIAAAGTAGGEGGCGVASAGEGGVATAAGTAGGERAPVAGMGDARLMVALGIALGVDAVWALLAACAIALVYVAVSRERAFPFGPCLAVPGCAVALMQALAVL